MRAHFLVCVFWEVRFLGGVFGVGHSKNALGAHGGPTTPTAIRVDAHAAAVSRTTQRAGRGVRRGRKARPSVVPKPQAAEEAGCAHARVRAPRHRSDAAAHDRPRRVGVCVGRSGAQAPGKCGRLASRHRRGGDHAPRRIPVLGRRAVPCPHPSRPTCEPTGARRRSAIRGVLVVPYMHSQLKHFSGSLPPEPSSAGRRFEHGEAGPSKKIPS